MPCRSLVRVSLVFFALWVAGLQADITVTRLANEGVVLSDGRARVMIDGMVVEPYSVYGGLPSEAAAQFDAVSGEFAGIDIALATHRHHEHNQPRFACAFMQDSPATVLYAPPQVIDLMREKCRAFVTSSPRVRPLAPQAGTPVAVDADGIHVTAYALSHGKRKYARIQHLAFLVEIGGLRVLHVGDAVMDPAAFAEAGLTPGKPDVALIPVKYFQPGPGAEIIARYLDAPLKLATHIPPGEMQETRSYLAEAFPRVMVLERPLQQVRFTGGGKQSP